MGATAASTPLLEQYDRVRARYPGHLVLFRVGDFYETFGDDAKLLARELDVQLTARAPDAHGQRTPMAGVPHHAVETYLARLVRKGHRVALCDQVEDPREAKGLVRREVTRIVTPGTVVEDGILGGPDHNFLAIVVREGDGGAWAAVDVSTGEWFHGRVDSSRLDALLMRLAPFFPRELLFDGGTPPDEELASTLRREFPRARLEPAPEPLEPGAMPTGLRAEEAADPIVAHADASLAAYVRTTQPKLLPILALVDRGTAPRTLLLDAKTLRHLEISRPMNPDDPGGATLLSTWDETKTAAGRRTLQFWLTHPLAELEAIRARQDAVGALVASPGALSSLRQALAHGPDLARIVSRIVGRRVRPPEVGALRDGLRRLPGVRAALASAGSTALLEQLAGDLTPPDGLLATLESALPEEMPANPEDGRLFRPGCVPELDRAQDEEAAAIRELEALERSEQEATGIRTLHVRYNQIFGYYLEVGRSHAARVPPHYRRRQTVAQAERFTTEALDEIAARLLEARERLREAEVRQWESFLAGIDRAAPALYRLSRALGALDAIQSFAQIAVRRRCVRPEVDDSGLLLVREGRHPVIEALLEESFVPNDTELDLESARLLVLTGPNMSGKSTYMRQVGLLVVLAQAGAFVPAKFARIGRVSGLFTRMGFTDEIGRGKSSFMVEMTEVAEILRDIDARSLVLLDEVGRGTSTFDGLAIAWATLRHLHDVGRCRAVLATHYHQLTQLLEGLRAAKQAHLAVRERPDGIVFLHRLVPGATDRSYGIHVAQLAGLPPELLNEARRLLRRLEAEGISLAEEKGASSSGPRYAQALLFAAEGGPRGSSAIEEELRAIDIDRMTPVEALRRLAELRARALARDAEGP